MTWDGATLTATFLAGGGGGYYGGGVTNGSTIMFGQTGYVASPATGGNGYVRITALATCIPGARVAAPPVTVHNLPNVNLGTDIYECKDQVNDVVLNAANAGSTFLWDDNSTAQTRRVDQSGIYSVAVTSPYGCINKDTIQVSLNPSPVVDLGSDTTVCPATSLNLNARNNGYSILWDDNSTNSVRNVQTDGTFYVSVTNSYNCESKDSITVHYFTVTPPNLGPDTAVCKDISFAIFAGNYQQYLWQDGSSRATYTVTRSGIYYVKVKDENHCFTSDTIEVTNIPRAETDGINYIPYFYEQMGKVKFSAINPQYVTSYFWDFGDGNTSNLVSPTHVYDSLRTYNVTLTVNSNDCEANQYDQKINVDFEETDIKNLGNAIDAKVYPNPAQNILNIELKDKDIIVQSVIIKDVLGKSIPIDYYSSGNTHQIQVHALTSGLYLALIQTNKGYYYAKFTINK